MEKEILEIAAICLYLFHGGLWFFVADLVHIQGEHVLRGSIPLLPLMSKGENEAEVCEVAIKSKGGDCWHYGSGVVLDGNPFRW